MSKSSAKSSLAGLLPLAFSLLAASAPSWSDPPLQPAPAMAEAATPSLGVYAWRSEGLIAGQQDENLWQQLHQSGINRILLGLNAGQIAQIQEQPSRLHGFLAAARRHGIEVELLLGDPGWIEPAQRSKLLDLIGALHAFDFAGLHLDIEPGPIYRQPLARAQFDDWMETLRSATQASPWPVGVSMHPRYFRDAPYLGWNMEQRLQDAGIKQVVLMIFSSDPQRVAEIAEPIVAGDGAAGLRFRVAQSVEPELQPQLSYAHRTPQDFAQTMLQLQSLLAQQPNTEGIVVQDWNDLQRMGYESQVH